MSSFATIGQAFLPQLKDCLRDRQNLRDFIRNKPLEGHRFTLTLLLASYLSGKSWKLSVLDIADDLLSDESTPTDHTQYLKMLARQRRKEVSRRIPGLDLDCDKAWSSPSDQRTNALHGQYLRSVAQDKIMEGSGDLESALKALKQFKYFSGSPSTMEQREMDLNLFMRGKILRWQASFDAASEVFHQLLESSPGALDITDCSLLGHLVGSLCEQGRPQQAERVIREAIACRSDLQERNMKRPSLGTYGCLQISLAETLICYALRAKLANRTQSEEYQQRLVESDRLFHELKVQFEEKLANNEANSWSTEINYLRVCVGRALTYHLGSHWGEALRCWEEARNPAYRCKDKVTPFVAMIIDFCEYDASANLGRWDEASPVLIRARNTLKISGREFWWTNLGTYLLDYLRTAIPGSGIDGPYRQV